MFDAVQSIVLEILGAIVVAAIGDGVDCSIVVRAGAKVVASAHDGCTHGGARRLRQLIECCRRNRPRREIQLQRLQAGIEGLGCLDRSPNRVRVELSRRSVGRIGHVVDPARDIFGGERASRPAVRVSDLLRCPGVGQRFQRTVEIVGVDQGLGHIASALNRAFLCQDATQLVMAP